MERDFQSRESNERSNGVKASIGGDLNGREGKDDGSRSRP
jgi:hypothetical protein